MILARGYRIPDGKPQDIPLDDNLGVHIIGSPGSGKSSLLTHLIAQEERFGLIDVEEHLSVEHDLLFDPLRAVQPFNLLKTERPYATTEDILACFRRAWPDGWGDRMADVLRHSILLLIEHGLTLADLPRLLSDEKYRDRLATQSGSDAVRLFFLEHLRGVGQREWRYWIESARNKVSQFSLSPYVRPFLETKDCLDFHDLFTKRVLFNLPERLMKDSAGLMGMLVVSKVYSSALERPEGSPHWRLFADEFQRLSSQAFLDLAARGRKRGVSIVVAHQSLAQLDPQYADSLLSTVGTKVVFSVGRKDAERMAKEILPPSGTTIKRAKKRHPIFGGVDVQSYYSVQEEVEAMATEIEYQKQGECFIKTGGLSYCATTFQAPNYAPLCGPTIEPDVPKTPKAIPEPRTTKSSATGRTEPPEYEGDPLA